MRQWIALCGCLLLCGLSGCGTARYVMKDPVCGIVAIPYNSNAWPTHYRDQAEKLMASHFPEGYIVDREEEAVIGHQTHHSSSGQGVTLPIGGRRSPIGLGVGTSSGTETTVNQTEYRFLYRRK